VAAFTSGTFAWGDYVAERFGGWLADPAGLVLIAEEAGEPVGVVHAVLVNPGEGWLEGMRVHHLLRRRGVASALNRAGVAWLTGQGAGAVRLAVDSTNEAARRQVEQLGWRSVAAFHYAEAVGPPDDGAGAHDAERRQPQPVLALPGQAAQLRRVWSSPSAARRAASHDPKGNEVLMARGWRWWSAGWSDVSAALRAGEVLAGPHAFAVVSRSPPVLEVRWLQADPAAGESGAAGMAALVGAARLLAHAEGLETTRLVVPLSARVGQALRLAGLTAAATFVIYAAPPAAL
jgi:GNAT superfamily N-acetyltransferase